MSTVWAHRSDKDAKYVYNAAKDSYQIWLDSPGTVEESDPSHVFITLKYANEKGSHVKAVAMLEKKPSEVEFDGERYGIKDWFATAEEILAEPIGVGIVDKGWTGGMIEVDAEVLTETTLAEGPPKNRYRVTMEVEAYDITQVMSEVYRGHNALIQRI